MSEKEVVKVYLSPAEASRFREMVQDVFGEVDGRQSEAARQAIREWSDMDRDARNEDRLRRMEDKLDEMAQALSEQDNTHTQTQHVTETTGKTATQRRVDKLVTELLPDDEQFPDSVVEDAIRDDLGYTDARTIEKYKRLLKNRAAFYQHPNGKVWYRNREDWFNVALYAPSNSGRSEEEVFAEYPDDVHQEFVDWLESRENQAQSADNMSATAVTDGGGEE